MNPYEIMYIVPTRFTETELPSAIEKVNKIIEKAGGKIIREENLGKKKLAYPVKKYHQGYYILNDLELEPKDLEKLNKDLKLAEEVIRFIVVKRYPRAVAAAALSKKRAEAAKAESQRTAETETMKKEEEKEKVKLEDLDKKLDEILESDNLM